MEHTMARGTVTIITAGVLIAMAAGSYVHGASQAPRVSDIAPNSYKVSGTGEYEVTPAMKNWGVNSKEFRAPVVADYPCCGYLHSDTPNR